jgi:hypothetical protein
LFSSDRIAEILQNCSSANMIWFFQFW